VCNWLLRPRRSTLVAAANEIAETCGVQVVGVQADVSKSADIERVLKSVGEKFGGADILVNNAGVSRSRSQ